MEIHKINGEVHLWETSEIKSLKKVVPGFYKLKRLIDETNKEHYGFKLEKDGTAKVIINDKVTLMGERLEISKDFVLSSKDKKNHIKDILSAETTTSNNYSLLNEYKDMKLTFDYVLSNIEVDEHLTLELDTTKSTLIVKETIVIRNNNHEKMSGVDVYIEKRKLLTGETILSGKNVYTIISNPQNYKSKLRIKRAENNVSVDKTTLTIETDFNGKLSTNYKTMHAKINGNTSIIKSFNETDNGTVFIFDWFQICYFKMVSHQLITEKELDEKTMELMKDMESSKYLTAEKFKFVAEPLYGMSFDVVYGNRLESHGISTDLKDWHDHDMVIPLKNDVHEKTFIDFYLYHLNSLEK